MFGSDVDFYVDFIRIGYSASTPISGNTESIPSPQPHITIPCPYICILRVRYKVSGLIEKFYNYGSSDL